MAAGQLIMRAILIVILFMPAYEYEISSFNDQLKLVTDKYATVLDQGFSWLLNRSLSMEDLTVDKARIVFALKLVEKNVDLNQSRIIFHAINELKIEVLKILSNPNRSADGSLIINAGHLTLYVSALKASCEDVANFFGYNLISLLKEKMDKYPSPDLSSYFAYSLGVIALCNNNRTIPVRFLRKLMQGMRQDGSYPFGSDETAVALMAFSCIQKHSLKMFSENKIAEELMASPESEELHSKISLARRNLITKLEIASSKNNCLSSYTNGLILQALLSVNKKIDDKLIEFAVNCLVSEQIEDGSFKNILATFQVLPVFAARNFLSISSLKCSTSESEHFFFDNCSLFSDTNVTEITEINNTITEISSRKRCLGNKYVKEQLLKLNVNHSDFLQKAVLWLLSQRTEDYGWKNYTAQAIVSLFLASPKLINSYNLESRIGIQIMKIQVLSFLINRATLKKVNIEYLSWCINALVATCHNPVDFYGHNLIHILRKKLHKYNNHYKSYGSFSLAILSMCNAGEIVPKNLIKSLTANMKTNGSLRSGISDTALAVLALSCVKRYPYSDIKSYLDSAVRYLRHHQKRDGHFATRREDLSSLATAAYATQALIVTGVGNLRWDFPAAMEYILNHQGINGSFNDLITTLQILPLLNGKTLLDIQHAYCIDGPCYQSTSKVVDNSSLDGNKNSHERINITFSVIDNVHFTINYTEELTVPKNSSVYQILQLLALQKHFTFNVDKFSFGHYLHTINNLKEDRINKYYWVLYQGADPSKNGIDETFPSENDYISFRYTKF